LWASLSTEQGRNFRIDFEGKPILLATVGGDKEIKKRISQASAQLQIEAA
jgi:hypothetical protein